MIDVAAVDDHPIILDSIAGWVSGPDSGIRVIATAATVDGLLAGPGRHAHVVLLDLDLGDGTTAERNVAVIRAESRTTWPTLMDWTNDSSSMPAVTAILPVCRCAQMAAHRSTQAST